MILSQLLPKLVANCRNKFFLWLLRLSVDWVVQRPQTTAFTTGIEVLLAVSHCSLKGIRNSPTQGCGRPVTLLYFRETWGKCLSSFCWLSDSWVPLLYSRNGWLSPEIIITANRSLCDSQSRPSAILLSPESKQFPYLHPELSVRQRIHPLSVRWLSLSGLPLTASESSDAGTSQTVPRFCGTGDRRWKPSTGFSWQTRLQSNCCISHAP